MQVYLTSKRSGSVLAESNKVCNAVGDRCVFISATDNNATMPGKWRWVFTEAESKDAFIITNCLSGGVLCESMNTIYGTDDMTAVFVSPADKNDTVPGKWRWHIAMYDGGPHYVIANQRTGAFLAESCGEFNELGDKFVYAWKGDLQSGTIQERCLWNVDMDEPMV